MTKSQTPRKHIRAHPDPKDYVQIDKDPERASFEFEHVALLREEAPMGGCGIVCLKDIGLESGQILKLKVGRLDPLKSQVVWVKDLAPDVVAAGIKYLE